MAVERLQKILSNAGVASRRSAEAMIVAGRVAVNGKTLDTLGARADPEKDEITVDGTPVLRERYRYVALHKPTGVLSSTSDDRGRPTVVSLVEIEGATLRPVGRLDLESEGLILLTNDGALTELLTHPRHEVQKEYLVAIDQPLGKKGRERLVRGVRHEGERLKADSVQLVSPVGSTGQPDARWLLITLHGGRKREIRRMLSVVGRRVVTLRRIRIGPLALGTLALGESRELTPEEVEALYDAAKRERKQLRGSMAEAPGMDFRYPHPIAIDGPAASGKSTLARALVERFGYVLLDTGLMYRAVALAALRAEAPANDAAACAELARSGLLRLAVEDREARVLLGEEDVTDQLRASEVEGAVSDYAAIAEVRRELVAQQRLFAAQQPSLLVGRDIGSVVLKDAPVKLYLQASEEVRAQRRGEQAAEWGSQQSASEAGRDISGRDTTDSTRAASPLVEPEGAIVIDTGELDADAMIARAIEAIEERTR
ncbi:MAG: (d)CMP kinase [Dehalococcoidia bacterium]|nr:(d)CMP kinase [Dehalococcoidia bacterium]MYA54041.1 (d)CMP kinase [Dehalococcoidia bacterium]